MTKDEYVAEQVFTETVENMCKSLKVCMESKEGVAEDYSLVRDLYLSLDEPQKLLFINFYKRTIFDVVSTLLGGIDGVTDVGNINGNFKLFLDDELISGSLQDEFIEIFQNEVGS